MNQIPTVRTGVNHALHLVLTIFTCGLWGIVWAILAIANPKRVPVQQVYVGSAPQGPRPVNAGYSWPQPGLYDVTQPDGTVSRGYFNGQVWE